MSRYDLPIHRTGGDRKITSTSRAAKCPDGQYVCIKTKIKARRHCVEIVFLSESGLVKLPQYYEPDRSRIYGTYPRMRWSKSSDHN
jgi:hypothetical protein